MTDFFTRLAQRTLGLAPTVQPMLASLYAPAADLGDNALLEIAMDEEVQNESVTGQHYTLLPEHKPAQSATQATTATIQNSERPTRANSVGIQPGPTRQILPTFAYYKDALSSAKASAPLSSKPLPSTGKAAQSVTATREGQPNGALVESLPDPNTIVQTDYSIVHHEQREVHIYTENLEAENFQHPGDSARVPGTSLAESLSVPTSMPQLPRRGVINHAPTQQDDPISSHLTNPPVGARLIAPRPVAPRQPTTGARTAATTSSRSTAEGKIPSVPLPEKKHQAQGEPLPSIQEISASAAPTIQVTIGRIEVHATPAPAPSEPSVGSRPTMPAVMSLDDYLQQRAKGGH